MYTNKSNVALAVAVWLASDDYDLRFNPKVFSATELLKPIRSIVLTRQMLTKRAKGEVDVMDVVPSRVGSAVHGAVEKAWIEKRVQALTLLGIPEQIQDRIRINPDTPSTDDGIDIYIEQRWSKKIAGYVISGMADVVMNGGVEDVKTTKVYNWIHGGNDVHYMQQESIYRWIVPHIITKDYCLIHFIFTDWNPLQAQIKPDYPKDRIMSRKMALMSVEQTEEFIRRKLAVITPLLTEYDQDKLPLCTPEELWQNPSVWKWYKGGKVTARSSKNFKSYAEAMAHTNGVGLIVEVPEKVKRCAYCNARVHCKQAAQLSADNLLD